jgi:hypothetical protein
MWLVENRTVGSLEWFAYPCFQQKAWYSAILDSRALLQEILCDMYACAERFRLDFIRNNQHHLRADKYKRLVKGLENQKKSIGKRVILPATFIGSPRPMSQLYHDSMALVRKYGTPSLFITMTANPNIVGLKFRTKYPKGLIRLIIQL